MTRAAPARRNIAERIARTLRASIVNGRLQPGEALPSERRLAERYDVNRSSIREAMQRLNVQADDINRVIEGSLAGAETGSMIEGNRRFDIVVRLNEELRHNLDAIKDGERILSAYTLKTGERLWAITEADRSSTCILTPDEF